MVAVIPCWSVAIIAADDTDDAHSLVGPVQRQLHPILVVLFYQTLPPLLYLLHLATAGG